MSPEPIAELDQPYSSDGAQATPWSVAASELEAAGVYWLTTVRRDGRPHVTPVVAVWMDGSVYFSAGPQEQKAKNLQGNRHVVVTTGRNDFHEGLDVVVEGEAMPMTDDATLHRLADLFKEKYDDAFGFRVRDGAFGHDVGVANVFEVAPVKAFSYSRGETGAATRYRF